MQSKVKAITLDRDGIIPDLRYGPLKIGDAVPWLLLASSVRYLLKTPGPGFQPLVVPFTQFCVFMAFAVVVHSTILSCGGNTPVTRMALWSSVIHLKSVLWKATKIIFWLIVLTLTLGVGLDLPDETYMSPAASLLLAFGGLAFPDGELICRIFGVFLAWACFHLVVLSAGGYPVTLQQLWPQMRRHWRHMLPAVILLVAATHFVKENQLQFGRFLDQSIEAYSPLKGWFYITYQTVFGIFRIWMIVAVLTHAHRRSCDYLRDSVQP